MLIRHESLYGGIAILTLLIESFRNYSLEIEEEKLLLLARKSFLRTLDVFLSNGPDFSLKICMIVI